MEEMLEMVVKRISVLEKKVEKYYQMLKIENELDFILSGNYVLDNQIENILKGNY